MRLPSLLREPLLHFLAIGAALFLFFHWSGGSGQGASRIVVTAGQIAALEAGHARTWRRPPTEAELKGLIDEYVREEIATREAMAMGLDRDDTVIRRRLRQKFEFSAEDQLEARPPTDAELQAYLETYPDRFRREPRLSLRQVHLGPQRGAALQDDARRLLERLATAGPPVDVAALGDSRLLPPTLERAALGEVARTFGDEFAGAVLKLEPGRWAGPIRSSYGLHVVIVDAREGGQMPALADVRPLVERDYMAERRRRQLDAMYTGLLARYPVVIEKQGPASAASAAEVK
jgi:hypothetical protein